MNHSIPVLLCDQSEHFRTLLRSMLSKHGFFHILEAGTVDESLALMKSETKPQFVLIHGDLVSAEIIEELKQKKFVIVAQSDDDRTISLATRVGVEHFLSFPFSSEILLRKVESLV